MVSDRQVGRRNALVAVLAFGLLGPGPAVGKTALVAVATNFVEVMERLEDDFERSSPHAITVTSGATGMLYAQIRNGAPFDVLLAADEERPERLESEGLAVRGSRFSYALGHLTLWSVDPRAVAAHGVATLRAGGFRRLAMANPAVAPYGAAAQQVLERLDLQASLSGKIVLGENVGQTYAMVASGNAELGFVARSSLLGVGAERGGSRWDVPSGLHAPIRQDAVLLVRAEDNSAARDLLAYLRRSEARAIIRNFGYGVE